MSNLVSLCLLKIEIVKDMNAEAGNYQFILKLRTFQPINGYLSSFEFHEDSSFSDQGAVSSEHPNNPRLIKELRGQRRPKKIQIESYANALTEDIEVESEKGVLPKSSREQTPMDEIAPIPDVPGELNFFSGNPFVEQTTGILHLYKKK